MKNLVEFVCRKRKSNNKDRPNAQMLYLLEKIFWAEEKKRHTEAVKKNRPGKTKNRSRYEIEIAPL